MKIESERDLIGAEVRDPDGCRLGRVVGVDCATDGATAAWFLVRLPGWRRQLRAVPAVGAHWQPPDPVALAYRRNVVTASPSLPADGRSSAPVRMQLDLYYASITGHHNN